MLCLNSNSAGMFYLFFEILFLFIFREGGREGEERERNIDQLPLTCPQPGTWPSTQACALTGNQTSPSSLLDDVQPTELHQSGLAFFPLKHSLRFDLHI